MDACLCVSACACCTHVRIHYQQPDQLCVCFVVWVELVHARARAKKTTINRWLLLWSFPWFYVHLINLSSIRSARCGDRWGTVAYVTRALQPMIHHSLWNWPFITCNSLIHMKRALAYIKTYISIYLCNKTINTDNYVTSDGFSSRRTMSGRRTQFAKKLKSLWTSVQARQWIVQLYAINWFFIFCSHCGAFRSKPCERFIYSIFFFISCVVWFVRYYYSPL